MGNNSYERYAKIRDLRGFTDYQVTKKAGIKGRVRSEYKENAILHIKEKYNKIVSDDEADAICIAEFGNTLDIE